MDNFLQIGWGLLLHLSMPINSFMVIPGFVGVEMS